MNFKNLFKVEKPIIAMLHLKGYDKSDIFDRAKKEIDAYYKNGVDAVMVENYFSRDISDCESVLAYLQKNFGDKIYGLNILGDYKKAFELANKYNAKYIQIDSVCGHLSPHEEPDFVAELDSLRESSNVVLLGGVRFKYQPLLSGRTVEEDLEIGKTRCDAIVVTGIGTGSETDDTKINQFRNHLGSFPIIVGAGVTLDSVKQKLGATDGAIIGSWFKENHKDSGDVCEKYVRQIMAEVQSLRCEISHGKKLGCIRCSSKGLSGTVSDITKDNAEQGKG